MPCSETDCLNARIGAERLEEDEQRVLEESDVRQRGMLIPLIGWVFLLVGLCAALIGPIELYTFYLFSAGGRFHYDGFGFGSLMFGNIAIQTGGYYVIALVGITLGYGHIRGADWSRKIALALLWDWLILGLPLSLIAFLMLLTSKDIPVASLPFVLVLLSLLYPILPVLAVRFYQSDRVRKAFRPSSSYNWVGKTPQAVLTLGVLMILSVLALHIPILFNGAFPLFGHVHYGLDGITMLDLAILVLAVLTWGMFRQSRRAWWGTMLFFCTMITSSIATFLSVDPHQVILEMRFSSLEMDALQGMPVEGYHLALLISLPALLTLVLILRTRRHLITCDPGGSRSRLPAKPVSECQSARSG